MASSVTLTHFRRLKLTSEQCFANSMTTKSFSLSHHEKFRSFNCNKDLIKEVKLELIKRLYKPIYIPLITLFCCYLLLFSKNQKNFKTRINLIFISVFFLIILSEVSVRYSVMSVNFMYIYLITPIIIYISGYLIFARLAKNA